jgi:glyoxylase-like metal-dependent hydrolase (beta-lactamase superfamily II)
MPQKALGVLGTALLLTEARTCHTMDGAVKMPPVRELRSGLWHWQAPHPDWVPTEPWSREVSSYAIDDGKRLLLFDPLGVPGEIEELAAGRETAIVLTCPWHERDTESLVERLPVPVFAPAPETQEDLMEKFGITAEQAEGGSPDLRWLRDADSLEKHWVDAGDRLSVGVQAYPGKDPKDLVHWIESQRAVIAGDSLVDFGRGLEINVRWLRKGQTREEVAQEMRPLLELPVEHVLPTHGQPTDRSALERALS